MTGPRIDATGEAGEVFIVTDVKMANAIADALEYAFAADGIDHEARRDYLLEVLQIRSAVVAARVNLPAPVQVLRLVSGDAS